MTYTEISELIDAMKQLAADAGAELLGVIVRASPFTMTVSWPDALGGLAMADPDDANDDGRRTLYAGGKMLKAIRDALQVAKAQLEEGGTLAVQYTGDGTATRPGANPPKLYVAQYQPPAPSTVGADVANLL